MNTIANDELNRVLHLLPRGNERLITANEISQVIGIDKRAVYKDIALLIDRYNIPIGGLRSDGKHGYFIITNETERKQALSSLRKQSIEMLKRIDKVDSIAL
ncbi:HTH domain-containing protein [Lapidilactobacillus bayanensis]|uniref:HTH domain-containing protein n=1 Tax=Lapidilactobacillus bayanensis TaxID=2485998 RepID=UPI000F7957E1|nr:HTH domain-containing protein [Lapidilactobacillus bayanensis]